MTIDMQADRPMLQCSECGWEGTDADPFEDFEQLLGYAGQPILIPHGHCPKCRTWVDVKGATDSPTAITRYVLIDEEGSAHNYRDFRHFHEARHPAWRCRWAVEERSYRLTGRRIVWTPDGAATWPPEREDVAPNAATDEAAGEALARFFAALAKTARNPAITWLLDPDAGTIEARISTGSGDAPAARKVSPIFAMDFQITGTLRDPATDTFSAIGAEHGLSDPDIYAIECGADFDFEEDGDVPADAEARWWARARIVRTLGLTECDRDPELPEDVAERLRRTSALVQP